MHQATKMPLDICAAAAGSAFACQFDDSSSGIGRAWLLLPVAAVVGFSLLLVVIL